MTALDLKIIGQRLRDLRKARKMTQRDLAEVLQVAQSTVSFIESGEVPANLEFLVILSRTFEVSLDYLVNGGEYITGAGDLTDQERRLLHTFRDLDPKTRDMVETIATNATIAARAVDTPKAI